MARKKRPPNKSNGSLQPSGDADLTKLRIRLNKKREYIAILELELFNTRASIQEFMALYEDKVRPLENRLRSLRRKLYRTLESQSDINGKEEPAPDYPAEEEAEFTYQDRDEKGWRIIENKAKPNNPKIEAKIRNLFRELAKRFHPDLTSDKKEKKWREQIMTQVNQAYSKRDLKTLQALAQEPDIATQSVSQSKKEEIAELKAELIRLDGVIADLKASINHLEESPAMQLKLEAHMRRKDGKDLLSEMQNRIIEQIDDLVEHLLVLGVEPEEEQIS